MSSVFLGKTLYSDAKCLCSQEYKWILANVMLREINPCNGEASHLEESRNPLVTSYYKQNQEMSASLMAQLAHMQISPYIVSNLSVTLHNQFTTQSFINISSSSVIFFTSVIFARLYIVILINFLLYLFRGPLVYQFNYYQMLPSPNTTSTAANTTYSYYSSAQSNS